ncbi:uncharacterized protein LOC124406314 [Diprion similis]|uniref:uncharacterized protein LOC124406314 n=1 Tax=Diprion similis TaxID=362088 RepID=UPI001EF75388|nr:uncharacterized protein LOC124406314 [Diprion similis]
MKLCGVVFILLAFVAVLIDSIEPNEIILTFESAELSKKAELGYRRIFKRSMQQCNECITKGRFYVTLNKSDLVGTFYHLCPAGKILSDDRICVDEPYSNECVCPWLTSATNVNGTIIGIELRRLPSKEDQLRSLIVLHN